MSIIGDKIHRIRDFRGMTQKQLGMAVGFDEKSSYTGLMHTLFALEDLYGFKIDRLDGEICIRINRQNGSTFAKMTGLLEPWEEMAQKYRNGEISREEYDQWRYRYPRSEAERNEAARRALKEDSNE